MARVLFAWEFGANLGHFAQLLMLAKRLRSAGHESTFALRDVTLAESALGESGFSYVQAPVWHPRLPRPPVIPSSYPEILQHYGYLDRQGLLGLTKTWREIFRWIKPDVAVFDHAPTALLASRGLPLARVLYGVGFASPPRVSPLPSFRTWENVSFDRLAESEASVLETANWVLTTLRLEPLSALHRLFDVEHDFLCTFSELDHYRARSDAQCCGAVFANDEGARPEWPDSGDKRICVYLRPGMRSFAPLAEALADSGHAVLWIAPGIDQATARQYETPRLRFATRPVRLRDAAASTDAAVLYGSHGTVSAMLLAGVPIALFPTHVEQALVSRNVIALGAGTMAMPDATVGNVGTMLESIFADAQYKERARAFATKYSGFDPHDAVERIARSIEAHCGTGH